MQPPDWNNPRDLGNATRPLAPRDNPYVTGESPWAKKSQTGRSFAMLTAAVIEAVKNRRAVYVIAANANHKRTLEDMLYSMNPPRGHGISIEDAEHFPELDWSTMRLRRGHPNCLVLVDHYAIEYRYAAVLRMWHAFDQDNVTRVSLAMGRPD